MAFMNKIKERYVDSIFRTGHYSYMLTKGDSTAAAGYVITADMSKTTPRKCQDTNAQTEDRTEREDNMLNNKQSSTW